MSSDLHSCFELLRQFIETLHVVEFSGSIVSRDIHHIEETVVLHRVEDKRVYVEVVIKKICVWDPGYWSKYVLTIAVEQSESGKLLS